jgi:hypothetical protein
MLGLFNVGLQSHSAGVSDDIAYIIFELIAQTAKLCPPIRRQTKFRPLCTHSERSYSSTDHSKDPGPRDHQN